MEGEFQDQKRNDSLVHLRSQPCLATKVGLRRERSMVSTCLDVVTVSGGSAASCLMVGLGSMRSAFGKKGWAQKIGEQGRNGIF